MAYYWTDQHIDWQGIDALELSAVTDLGDAMEQVTSRGGRIDLYSVYIHREGQGAECIADRPTYQQALGLANSLGAARGLPVNNYAYGVLGK